MPRLYRPAIPVEVKCRVVLRQLGELWIDEVVGAVKKERRLGHLLAEKLEVLAALLGCKIADLRLDHDPALGARQRKGRGKNTVYTPDANNPEFLIYREKRAHHIKTNVRGDGAQHPDRVLIKKERERRDGKKKKRKTMWPKRKLVGRSSWPKRQMRRE